MSYDLFKDYVPAISNTKVRLMDGDDEQWEKQYPPFLVNRNFSNFQETVLYANEMNRLPLTDNKLQFDYLINSLRKQFRRSSKWLKPDFFDNVGRLSEITGEEATTWNGYLSALKNRREFFKSHGATATDHGHPSAHTSALSNIECQKLLGKCLRGAADAQEKDCFRGQMLTEMAAMSLEDGLVMQLHVGVSRNHNKQLFNRFGQDKGADIPIPMEFVEGLKPLLQRFGNESSLSVILFTLDESTYSRELAPLAGHYPCLRLGPAWWFHDSPEGMMRYRQQVSETAGFYNTVGFNDDTRALFSIPARHDLARRIDCQFLAGWVVQRRFTEHPAIRLAKELAYGLAKDAYRVGY